MRLKALFLLLVFLIGQFPSAYSAELGRFISRDPTGQADGPNQYQGFNNNLLNLLDPTGQYIIFPETAAGWHEALEFAVEGVWEGLKGMGEGLVAAAKTVVDAITDPKAFFEQAWQAVDQMAGTVSAVVTEFDRPSVFRALDLFDRDVSDVLLQATSARPYHFGPMAQQAGRVLAPVVATGAVVAVTKFTKYLNGWVSKTRKGKRAKLAIAAETGKASTKKMTTGSRMKVPRRLSPSEMEALTKEHGTEFSLVYYRGPGNNGGGGYYELWKGTANTVQVPVQENVIWIYHTHPQGTALASGADINVLTKLQAAGSPQRTSQIIPIGKSPVKFTVEGTK